MKLDGAFLNHTNPNCSPDSYFVDLHDVPGQGCVACALRPGRHVVTFEASTECAPDLFYPAPCVSDTFFIEKGKAGVAAGKIKYPVVFDGVSGNPIVTTWHPLFMSFGGQFFVIGFDPCAVCDVAPCDSIYFIQVIQPLEDLGSGLPLSKYTYTQQRWPDAAARDSALTQRGYAVDVPPHSDDPYCRAFYQGMVAYAIGSKDGGCTPAYCSDDPNRGDDSYQPGTHTIVLKYEINAFCGAGQGRGQWLGGATWMWQRPAGGSDSITLGPRTRSWPSTDFLGALALWLSLNRGFALPGFAVPVSGGMPCN